MLTLLLLACSHPPAVEGRVVDVWGRPVAGATVVIEGVVQRYAADGAGAFRIETEAPVRRVMVGKEGYIKHVEPVASPPAEGEDYPPLTFELFPEPESPGFYAVGVSDYVPVEPQRIVMVGTDLRHFTGIREIPSTGIASGEARFVFTSRLAPSELSRMSLQLSELAFQGRTPVKGLLGPVDATVNLWTPSRDIPFDLVQLESRDDYLITPRVPLVAGTYAFHAQNVLNELDERVYLMMPKEMQVAFPFEVH